MSGLIRMIACVIKESWKSIPIILIFHTRRDHRGTLFGIKHIASGPLMSSTGRGGRAVVRHLSIRILSRLLLLGPASR